MTETQRPLILVSNDDGIDAKGIRELVRVAARHGDVIVAAPNKGYSGQSHSITVMAPLTVDPRSDVEGALKAYAIGGSPVDCIKLGYHALVPRKPDLVLSGINHGSNASASVHYSGTLGAAREAAMLGMKSIGFSLCEYGDDLDFGTTCQVADKVIAAVLKTEGDEGVYYNVNVPNIKEIKGIRACRVAHGKWHEEPHRYTDPYGREYIWLCGTYENCDTGESDDTLLEQGYTTISPCKLDVTDYERLRDMSQWAANLWK